MLLPQFIGQVVFTTRNITSTHFEIHIEWVEKKEHSHLLGKPVRYKLFPMSKTKPRKGTAQDRFPVVFEPTTEHLQPQELKRYGGLIRICSTQPLRPHITCACPVEEFAAAKFAA